MDNTCLICGGDGIVWDDYGNGLFHTCECRKEKILQERITRAMIPPVLIQFISNENMESETISKLESGNGFVFIGKPGTGKSVKSADILMKYIKTGKSGLFLSLSEFMAVLRESYSKPSEIATELKQRALNDDLVVIDDYGFQRMSEHTNEILYLIINKRYETMKPIIINSMYPEEELKHYHYPIYSRLKQSCTWQVLKGIDRRI